MENQDATFWGMLGNQGSSPWVSSDYGNSGPSPFVTPAEQQKALLNSQLPATQNAQSLMAAMQAPGFSPCSLTPDDALSLLEDLNKESVFFFFLSKEPSQKSTAEVYWSRKNNGVRQNIRLLSRDSWLINRLGLANATGWHAAEYDYVLAMAVAEKMASDAPRAM